MGSSPRQNFKKKVLATSIAALASVSYSAIAQDAAPVEEVLVTGMRSALEKSVDIKRNSSQIVEAITADDIGKMPDQNVADSLQRVPGVQIDRAGGEGTKVRIRGLGNNLTLLNGDAFISGMEYYQAGEGRTEFDGSLEGVPSELLGGVEVIKTARASDVEGAVGGIVNLKTRSPLTLKEPVIVASLKADMGAESQEVKPNATLVVGNSWDNFGAIFSLTAAQKTVQVDEAQNLNRNSFGWQGTNVTKNSDGKVTAIGANNQWYVVPGMQYETDKQFERERIGASLALAWAPTDNSEITFDWFHSSLNIDDSSYSMKYTMNTDDGALIKSAATPYSIDSNGVLTSGSFETSGENNAYRDITDITTDNFKLGYKLEAGDKWAFDGGLSFASSDLEKDAAFADGRYQPYKVNHRNTDGTAWESSALNVDPLIEAMEGGRYISMTQGSSGTPGWSLSPKALASLNNPGSLLYKSNWAYGDRSTNESLTVVANATYNLEFGDVKNIKFGIRQANSEVDFVEGHYQVDLSCGTKSNGFSDITGGPLATDGSVQGVGACIPDGHNLGDIDGDGISDNQVWGPTTRYVDANIPNPAFGSKTSTGKDVGTVLYGTTHGRWDGTAPGIMPFNLFTDRPDYYTNVDDFFPSGGAVSSGLFADTSKMGNAAAWLSSMAGGAPTMWVEDKVQSWNVERNVTAVYAEANLEGDTVPYTLNMGVRVVRTDTTTTGGQTTPDDIYSGTDSWNGPVLVQGTFSIDKSYTDVLPSLNFSLDTGEDQKVRFAMARVMSQPDAQALGHGANYNFTRSDARGGYAFVNGTVGNPNLDPFRATQADLSYEWYLDDLSYLAVGTFLKAVDSFPAGVSTPTRIADSTREGSTVGQVNSTVNGSGGIVKGFEVAYQQGFDNGLGFAVNYTFSDSKTDLESFTHDSLPLPGVSENTFNIVGFYEIDRLQARIAYTWRDEYLSPDMTLETIAGLDNVDGTIAKEVSNFASYYDAYGQLDMSVSFDVTDNLSISAEGINLTAEEQRRYIEYTNFFRSNIAAERRFVLGAKYSF